MGTSRGRIASTITFGAAAIILYLAAFRPGHSNHARTRELKRSLAFKVTLAGPPLTAMHVCCDAVDSHQPLASILQQTVPYNKQYEASH